MTSYTHWCKTLARAQEHVNLLARAQQHVITQLHGKGLLKSARACDHATTLQRPSSVVALTSTFKVHLLQDCAFPVLEMSRLGRRGQIFRPESPARNTSSRMSLLSRTRIPNVAAFQKITVTRASHLVAKISPSLEPVISLPCSSSATYVIKIPFRASRR